MDFNLFQIRDFQNGGHELVIIFSECIFKAVKCQIKDGLS